MNVAAKRKLFAFIKAGLGIVVQIMLLLPSIPMGGAIAGVIVADIASIFADFYQVKDGRRGISMETIEKTCDFYLIFDCISYLASMGLNIASIVNGNSVPLQLAALAVSLFVRMVLYDWVVDS